MIFRRERGDVVSEKLLETTEGVHVWSITLAVVSHPSLLRAHQDDKHT